MTYRMVPTTAVCDLYDPITNTMQRIGDLTTPRGAYAAAGTSWSRTRRSGGGR